MTVEVEVNKKLFDHNGVSPSVSFTFRVLQNSDLKYYTVDKTNPLATPQLRTEGVHYNLALNDGGEGGVVTFIGTIPSSDYRGILITEYAFTQPSDLPTEGNFSEEAVEAALDRNTLLNIQIKEQLDRTLRFPLGDTATVSELPSAGSRAGGLFAFDANGNVTTVQLTELEQLAVSSYFAQLASSADAQSALLILGIPYYPAEIGASAILRFYENTSNGSNYVDLSAPDSLASSPLIRLPSQAGTLALLSDIPTSQFTNVVQRRFTVNDTYEPTEDMKVCIVECIGGGGGGGGGNASSSGSGGGAGCYSRSILTAADIGVSKPVVIGSGGAAGAIGGNGGNGSATTLGGTLVTAPGGTGGVIAGLGGAGGVAGTASASFPGTPGHTCTTASGSCGGNGGNGYFGGAGIGGFSSVGGAAQANSGGGGGGASGNYAGGAGAAGVMIITEYI